MMYSAVCILLTRNFSIKEPTTIFISHGDTLIKTANALKKRYIINYPQILIYYGKLRYRNKKIYAGEYQITSQDNIKTFLKKITTGEVIQYAFTIIEGQKFADIINDLNKHPKIASTLTLADLPIIMKLLNTSEINPEGLFLPETYFFTAYTKDIDILKRAYTAMQTTMNLLWKQRTTVLPLKSPYEALILASIIEKETHIPAELPMVSGVLQRRLQKNMRLQADPTVIYGLNRDFNVPLTRQDLSTPSSYNTYLIFGLPPTPIASPSIAAIKAALNPEPGDSLYFVANGNGGHTFTNTIDEHNKAIARWKKTIKQPNH